MLLLHFKKESHEAVADHDAEGPALGADLRISCSTDVFLGLLAELFDGRQHRLLCYEM